VYGRERFGDGVKTSAAGRRNKLNVKMSHFKMADEDKTKRLQKEASIGFPTIFTT
jgi:hypothetical protein